MPVHVVRGGPMWAEGRGADIFLKAFTIALFLDSLKLRNSH